MSMVSVRPSVYTQMSDSRPGSSSAAAAPPNGASRARRTDVAAPVATADLTDLVRIFTMSNPWRLRCRVRHRTWRRHYRGEGKPATVFGVFAGSWARDG